MQEFKLLCYHCGDDCRTTTITVEDKSFCCEGCKQVYLLLNNSGLEQFYCLDEKPKIKGQGGHFDYSSLDDKDIASEFIKYQEGDIAIARFFVPAIHCSSCIWLLENLNKIEKNIISSEVNFNKRELTITFRKEQISLRKVAELLDKIRYQPAITSNNNEKTVYEDFKKKLILKLGVAGFFFGNIMLLSFPEYLTSFGLDKEWSRFFGYINIALSLPVLIYPARDYYLSAYTALKNRTMNIDVPITLGIIALYAQSLFEILTESGAGYLDSFAGLIFFLLLGKWYQQKTYDALSFEKELKSFFPLTIIKISKEKEEQIKLSEIKTGDIIKIRSNEIIPVDSKLLSDSASIDYSFVSGESIPVSKKKGELIYAGGKQKGANILLRVTKNVEESYLNELWNKTQTEREQRNKEIKSFIDVVSKRFTTIILSIAVLSFIYWYFTDPSKALNAFSTVLIIACPCALALAFPFTAGTTLRILGKNGLFLKNQTSLEAMANINTVIFDKTGTLTQKENFNIESFGTFSEEEISWTKSITSNSLHPLSVALFEHLNSSSWKAIQVTSFSEIPSKGIEAYIEGHKILIGNAEFVTGCSKEKEGTRVYVSIDGETKGGFEFSNVYRKGIAEMTKNVATQNHIYVLSGDNEGEKEHLMSLIPNLREVKFYQKPEDKKNYIKLLQSKGNRVMMLGDGINDAAALEMSDCGVAVCDNVFQFSPGSDAILQAEQIQNLDKYLELSKKAMRILKTSLLISLSYNIVGLSFAVQAKLSPLIAAIFMPLSSITIVSFVTLSVMFAAKKLNIKTS